MLIANNKPICLIGYRASTLTQEAQHFFAQEFSGQILVLTPEEFFALDDKNQYQYGVAFSLDRQLRQKVIDIVDSGDYDCIKYCHPTVVCYTKDIDSVLGRGSFVSPFSTILLGSQIGNHCIIETYCLISHYVELGNNAHLHSGTMIAGRTRIGANCMFNFKSAVLNALVLGDNIEVGAASTVTKNLDQSGKYVGSPARKVSSNA